MYDLTEEQLQQLGNLFIESYKKKLKAKIYPFGNPNVKGLSNKVASGSLLRSMKSKVVDTPDGFMLQLEYLDYFNYVNRGRKKGKMPPEDVILKWIKDRKIRPRDKKGRFVEMKVWRLKGLAYVIRRSIGKFGIRPAKLFDNAYDALEDLLTNPPAEFRDEYERLYDAIGNDVENFIIKTLTPATTK